MSLFHIQGLKPVPQKSKSIPFLEHLDKFNLDLCSQIYNNSPHVSCLGMNTGRGWNPNWDGSYLPEYSEYEAETWTPCTSVFYIVLVKFLAPKTSTIPIYIKFTKTYQF